MVVEPAAVQPVKANVYPLFTPLARTASTRPAAVEVAEAEPAGEVAEAEAEGEVAPAEADGEVLLAPLDADWSAGAEAAGGADVVLPVPEAEAAVVSAVGCAPLLAEGAAAPVLACPEAD